MDVRFYHILPYQNLLCQEFLFGQIRDVVTEGFESIESAAGIFVVWSDENVNIERGTGIAMDRKGGGADNHMVDLMLV